MTQLCRREMEKMKDAVNAAAGGDGVRTRRIAGDAGREYILQTEDDTKAKAALDAGLTLQLEPLCNACAGDASHYCHSKAFSHWQHVA